MIVVVKNRTGASIINIKNTAPIMVSSFGMLFKVLVLIHNIFDMP
jgi:hypothetical protein